MLRNKFICPALLHRSTILHEFEWEVIKCKVYSVKIRLIKLVDKVLGSLITGILSAPSLSRTPAFTRVLFIRPGGIGDAVLLIPVISAIKEKFPKAEITVLAEKRNGSVFLLCPMIDRTLRYDNPTEMIRVMQNRYDVVIDTEQWYRLSAVVARLTRAPMLICFATNERKNLFTHHISYSHDDYETDSFVNLLAPFGISASDCLKPPYLVIRGIVLKRAENLLADLSGKPFVVIFPGASIPERRWGAEKFRGVAAKLHAKGILVVVVGGREDASDAEKIIAGMYGLNLAGKTSLAETAAVIERSRLLVSGDSGILHIGVGLGKPTVSLFGPGIAKKWAPRGDRHIVLNKCLPCSPCTRFGHTPKCPINAKCMADVTVDEVVAGIENLLN